MIVSATILAAGSSSRMGEENKLLLPVNGIPMIRQVVNTVLKTKLSPVHLVTGFDRKNILEAVLNLSINEVYNPNESISAHKVCLTSDSDILIKDTCFDKEIVGGRNVIKLKSKIKSFDIESWQNFNIKL
jgi:choline kinase